MSKLRLAFGLALGGCALSMGCTSPPVNSVHGGPYGPAQRNVELTLASPEPVTIDKEWSLPNPGAGEVGADVLFLVDVTNSFKDDIKTFRQRAVAIVQGLTAAFSDLRVGLALFSDAPCHGFGKEGPAYALDLALTPDLARFEPVLADVNVQAGGDLPEAQFEALAQAITGSGQQLTGACAEASIAPTRPGWQTGRLPFVVLATDAPFHDPSDVGKRDGTYPYPASFESVAALAQEKGVTVLVLDSGASDSRAKKLAEQTHGRAFPLSSDSSGVVEAIQNAMGRATGAAEVRLLPEGDSAGFVQRIEPERLTGIDLSKQRSATFKVTFKRAVQPKAEPQTFRFKLQLRINQAPVQATEVVVVVPSAG